MVSYGKKKEGVFMNTEQFTDLADAYAKGRPDYAEAMIDDLYARFAFSPDQRIADIGSGTGKLAAQLLKRGSVVFAVEPNKDMRESAKHALGAIARFHSVCGSAEQTTLADQSIDHITCAQAFHWFDPDAFRRECARILKPGGKIMLIWNVRDMNCPVNQDCWNIYARFCPGFHGFQGGVCKDDPRIRHFFHDHYTRIAYVHPITFTQETFIQRCLSASYTLKPQDPHYDEFLSALKQVWDDHAQDEKLIQGNRSVLYAGTLEQ